MSKVKAKQALEDFVEPFSLPETDPNLTPVDICVAMFSNVLDDFSPEDRQEILNRLFKTFY